MFETVIGQAQAKQTLESMLRSGSIPHALLFAGPNGVGKTELAIAFAARLLCEKGPAANCHECSGCRRAMRLEHPDLHLLFPFRGYPEKKDKQAEWVDELIAHRNRLANEPYAPIIYEEARVIVRKLADDAREQLMQGSLEGGRKVCIILMAEKMHSATANSLLKILEEPPSNVHFILTAERLSDVLPTIVSRCSVIPFRRLRQDEIEAYLAASEKLAHDTVVSYAEAAEGSLKTAKALAFEQKAELLDYSRKLFGAIARGPRDGVFDVAVKYLRSRDSAGAEELLKGFIQCTRTILDAKYEVTGSDSSAVFDCTMFRKVGLEALDRLTRQFESGLEMLGRNVSIAAVLTMVFFHIQETFAHA